MTLQHEITGPTRLDTVVEVIVNPDGDPTSFIWDRFEHIILGQPQAIFRRTKWWETGQAPTRIDTELWRIDASRGGEEPQHRYDLRRDADGTWVLALDWG